MDPDKPGPQALKTEATLGLVNALRALNTAAVFYLSVFGRWPRFNESVARILTMPLDAVQFDQLMDVSVYDDPVPGGG
jgi:hypothetical protein